MLNAKLDRLPILILYPHARCNCRCLMCDIWKTTADRSLTAAEIKLHLADIERLEVEQVVFSGGEPLMSPDLFEMARLLRGRGVRTSLLTTGLLLERLAEAVAGSIDEVIVSLDGPPEIHDEIRRTPGAYGRLEAGLVALRDRVPTHARTTVQRANCRQLRATVDAARSLRLRSISFLAADLHSEAFNRAGGWPRERQAEIALGESDVAALAAEIATLPSDPFIRESPRKLQRIVEHFRAALGQTQTEAPRCNAPWVSAVVETDGTIRPCFFHRPIGNVHDGLEAALNSSAAQQFRSNLRVDQDPTCRRCVCSLHRTQPSDAA